MAEAESGKAGGEGRSAWSEEGPREEGFPDLGGMLSVYSESTGTMGALAWPCFNKIHGPPPC